MNRRLKHDRLIGRYHCFTNRIFQSRHDFDAAHVGAGQDERLRVQVIGLQS